MDSLLAVDLGLRTGLALFGAGGRLVWYRSKNFGSTTRLRRGARGLLRGLPEVGYLVLEGERSLARIWLQEADRRGIHVRHIAAETWREDLLFDRERKTGREAKRNAEGMARRIIAWSGAPRPTSLGHDAAEAILIGFWGALEFGLLDRIPPSLLRG